MIKSTWAVGFEWLSSYVISIHLFLADHFVILAFSPKLFLAQCPKYIANVARLSVNSKLKEKIKS